MWRNEYWADQLRCCLQKVCITVPGVRPLPEDELARRMQAVELIRSGISEELIFLRLDYQHDTVRSVALQRPHGVVMLSDGLQLACT